MGEKMYVSDCWASTFNFARQYVAQQPLVSPICRPGQRFVVRPSVHRGWCCGVADDHANV